MSTGIRPAGASSTRKVQGMPDAKEFICQPTAHKFRFADIQPISKRDAITGDERMVGCHITIFCGRCGIFRTERVDYADK
jgi:hypothetical protein